MQSTVEFRAAERRLGQSLNGKWLLERLIDVGGTASVYEASHRNGRRAAIKVLHATVAGNAEVRRRFLREGYVANRIDHPAAVAILDDDVAEDGSPYLIMELLEGESLARRLSRLGGRQPFAEAAGMAGQLLDVLDRAHANGVVHRDIKPGNIFVTSAGHTKLLDFGFARVRDGMVSSVPTLSGIVLGTAGYLAPEQARGLPDEIDARTDVFGLGAVMFRAIVGHPLHDRPTQIESLMAGMKEPAPPLASLVPDVPPGLAGVVDRALAFEKADRWPSARAMHQALAEVYAALWRKPPKAPLAEPPDDSPIFIDDDGDEPPSLVADIAFGDDSHAAFELERRRTREVADAMPSRRRADPG